MEKKFLLDRNRPSSLSFDEYVISQPPGGGRVMSTNTKLLNARIAAIPLPERMKSLPISDEGFPIPWFVQWLKEDKSAAPRGEGTYDFRIMSSPVEAHRRRLCWICGQSLGTYKVFVVGPMCTVNRVSAEPPSHLECAEYAVKACPFLTQPKMRRNEKDIHPLTQETEGMIKRNPGVTTLWATKSYRLEPVNPGVLFFMGDPEYVSWYREGRRATRREVLDSIESGIPELTVQAEKQGMILGLPGMIRRALRLVPSE